MFSEKLKSWYDNVTLKNKLIALFAVLVLCVSIVVSAMSTTLASNFIVEKNKRYFKDITDQATENISHNIGNMEQITFDILSNLTIQGDLRTVNAKSPVGLDKTYVANEIENILLRYTLNNDSIISLSVYSDNGVEFNVKQSGLYKPYQLFNKYTIYDSKGTTLWGMYSDHTFCLARAIFDLNTQKPIGYINIVISESYFGDIVKNISSSIASGTYLLDDNNVIMSSNNKSGLGELAPFYRQVSLINTDSTQFVQNGERSIIYKGDQLNNGWMLVTLVPQNELAKDINTLMLLILLVDTAVILIAFTVILISIKRITNPITQLCRNMEEVGLGNFKKKVTINSNDEIGMLSKSFNSMVENIDNLIKTVYKLELTRKQAELDFLKMQINPHFLYNTLETINWMARIEKNMDIANVTTALGELLRANVHQNDLITIADEIKNIDNYLTIQAFRFRDKIKTEISVDDVYEVRIPNFILQPLVENAIIHGLEPKLTDGLLQISVRLEGAYIRFTVQDNGVGIDGEKLRSIRSDLLNTETRKSIGLKNVNKRLRLYYGNNCQFCIDSKVNLGTVVSFRVPSNNMVEQK